MSIRLRLLAGLFLVLAAGIATVDIVTYVSLRQFLFERVDEQLLSARLPANLGLNETANGVPVASAPKGRLSYVPPGTYAELRNSAGKVIQSLTFSLGPPGPLPILPATLQQAPDLNSEGQFFTTGARRSSEEYRVLASSTRGDQTLVVAIPLNDVYSTLNRVLIIELIVSVAALAGVCLVGWWLVRLGLRPLTQVERTAVAIADGDLNRRINNPNRRTEVGRLGLAFNSMIDRIQRAFDERAATERRLRQFVADASHELRTPLTSIRGYAELFSHDTGNRSPEDIERAMHRIEAETRRMGIMVEDLLLLARLDQEAPLKRTTFNFSGIVEECVADMQVVDPERRWTTSIEPGLIVDGDENRLRQVVTNLLANVRFHTPPQTNARVTLGRAGNAVVLEVADDGPGIAPEALGHVFERFYRADKARTRRRGGSGLGLAIVDAIVAAHGGTVSVASEPGHGARFSVRLPALKSPASAQRGPGEPLEAPSPARETTAPAV